MRRKDMNATMKELGMTNPSGDRRRAKRLDDVALALVLIMTGGLWLAPKTMFPEMAWLVGAGLILLGLNAARHIIGLKTRGLGIVVGLVALAAGIGRIVGQDLPFVPILLIILGAGLVIRAASRGSRAKSGPDAA
jgi:hypothetical protein